MGIASTLAASGILTGVGVGTAFAVVLRQTGVLKTLERLQNGRTEVQMVKEQRRMAETLPPGSSLTHVTPRGGRLTLRAAAPPPVTPSLAEE
jgi:hypothetical protein